METKTTYSGGIGFFGLLTIVFIVLKLTGVITWGWVMVLSPLWIPLAVLAVVGIIIACFVAVKFKDNDDV